MLSVQAARADGASPRSSTATGRASPGEAGWPDEASGLADEETPGCWFENPGPVLIGPPGVGKIMLAVGLGPDAARAAVLSQYSRVLGRRQCW